MKCKQTFTSTFKHTWHAELKGYSTNKPLHFFTLQNLLSSRPLSKSNTARLHPPNPQCFLFQQCDQNIPAQTRTTLAMLCWSQLHCYTVLLIKRFKHISFCVVRLKIPPCEVRSLQNVPMPHAVMNLRPFNGTKALTGVMCSKKIQTTKNACGTYFIARNRHKF